MISFKEFLAEETTTDTQGTTPTTNTNTTSTTQIAQDQQNSQQTNNPIDRKVQMFLKILERYGKTLGVAINGGTIIKNTEEGKGFKQIRYNLKNQTSAKILNLTFSDGQKLVSR